MICATDFSRSCSSQCPKTLRSYLKNKVFEEDGFIAWSAEGDSDLWGLGIDYATTLTSGSKVLYQGR